MQKKSHREHQALEFNVRKTRLNQPYDKNYSITVMQRRIQKLERTLAQRENEVWTLKQLLLYR